MRWAEVYPLLMLDSAAANISTAPEDMTAAAAGARGGGAMWDESE